MLLWLDRTGRTDYIRVLYIIKVGSDWKDGLDPCKKFYCKDEDGEADIQIETEQCSLTCPKVKISRCV